MMQWYHLKSESTESSRKLASFLKKRRLMVRWVGQLLYTCIGTRHQKWLGDVVRDYSTTVVSLDQPPQVLTKPHQEEYKAPCGELFYDPRLVSTHQRYCEKCREIRGAPPVAKQEPKVRRKAIPKAVKEAPTIARIEPGENFTLEGVITSVETTRNHLQSQLDLMGGLLDNLKTYQTSREMIEELDTEVKGRLDAVKLLIRDGKIS